MSWSTASEEGEPAKVLARRAPKEFDRLSDVRGSAVMMRQLVQVVVEAVREHPFDRLRRPLVEKRPPLREKRVVCNLLRETA
jgi:hypothetical protein